MIKKLPETKLLYIFQVVSKVSSISKAAEILDLTQSTVSHQIQRLEKQLQVSLFEREVRPLKLSKAGLYLLESSKRYIQNLEETVYFLQHQKKLALQELRLGMSSFIADIFLAEIIKAVEKKVVSIQVNTASASELNNQFLQQNLDCVISSKALDVNELILKRKICQQGIFGIYSKSLPKNITFDQLCENALFVDFPVTTQLGSLIKQLFFRIGKNPKRRITVDTTTSALQILKTMPAWTISLPLAMMNYIDITYQNFITVFNFPEPNLNAEIYLFSSRLLPNELLDCIQTTMISYLNEKIMTDHLSKFPFLKKLVTI